ncbi:MAG: NTP/NDP exchange transporter, partial [Chlamydiia bacterium]|nr:NTP/NDP exchange transporter [Chlamydiia bacterium]
ELKKLIPMLIMAFFISFNYTILRDTKDSLIVTSADAEAIPFLKTIGVVPMAILYMIIYTKLSNVLSRENLFYAAIAPFIIFFGLFSTVIYPNRDLLHPTSLEWLTNILPAGWSGFVGMCRYWTFSLFYVMSELWGSAVLSLLFWGFANQITKISESKRFYTLFGLGFNVALMVSGPLIAYYGNMRKHLPADADAWGVTLNYLMAMVTVAAVIIAATYYWMNRNVLTDERFYDPSEVKQSKKKLKMGIMESFLFILRSRYLLCLTIMVMGYGIAINIVEVTWKKYVGMQFSNPNDYVSFMGYFSTVTGIVTILMILFVGGNVIRMKGWHFAALFTPVVLTLTGLGFFSFVLLKDNPAVLEGLKAFGATPLLLAVLFGAAQNILSKSTKYSLFDPTKEMTYIPLDPESKVKGKAAVDVVGARLGKSGGSFIQIVLFSLVGGIAQVTPYVAGILLVIIAAWVVAVNFLNKDFHAKLEEKQNEEKEESERKKTTPQGTTVTA